MPLVTQDAALAKQLFAVHGTLAFVLVALITCHITAALVHLFFKRDGIFERMWPGKSVKTL